MITVKITADDIDKAIMILESAKDDYEKAEMEDGDTFMGPDLEIEYNE